MNLKDLKHRAELVAEEWLDRVLAAVQTEHAVTMQRHLLVAELEERILMSAAPAAVVAVEAQPLEPSVSPTVTTSNDVHSVEQPANATIDSSMLAQLDVLLAEVDAALATDDRAVFEESTTSLVDVAVQRTRGVVFVDPSVEGFSQVVDELLRASTDQHVLDVVLLDSSRNGLAQITAALSERQDVDALHVVSQGSDRDFKVGSTWLSLTNLSQYRSVIEGWSNAFAANPELRLYGCDLEQSSVGRALIGELETATGADVVVTTSVAVETIRSGLSLDLTVLAETTEHSDWVGSTPWSAPAEAAIDRSHDSSQPAAVLVVVDPQVEDADTLLRGIQSSVDASTTVDVLVLDPARDGLEQITERLQQSASDVGALHFVTHGTDRAFRLGTTWIDVAGFEARRDQFSRWSHWLTAEADVLFYGCDLAASESGRWLLTEFATLTQTDVAASTNATGSERLGGDWDLEFQQGDVETAVIIDEHTQRAWNGLLATFTVTNTNDSGAGSLRQAILDANALSGLDVIDFALSGSSPYTINLTSKLPDISDAVTLDGWTQAGFSVSPIIELDGTNAGSADGLRLASGSGGSTIRGLVINRFANDGIRVDSDGNTIVGNYIGTDVTGLQDLGNNHDGLHINGAFNTIGGTTALLRNVISGNADDGIDISGSKADGNIVIGNLVGLGADGSTVLGQGGDGIVVTNGATNNVIGGTAAGSGNIVSNNANDGIELSGSGTSGNQVLGNYVGTDLTGLLDRGNIDDGIQVSEKATNNVIGGTTSAHRNVVAGNDDDGVQFNGNGTSGNWLLGNYVGLASDGTPLGNADNGVEFHTGAAHNTVGGTNAGEGNVIAYNADNGVDLDATSGNENRISGNSIYSNDDLGIDLNSDGVTTNDVGDTDSGPNQRQNFPELTSVLTDGATIFVTGSLSSAADQDFHIELFANDDAASSESSGFGQGQTYLGSFTVTTDASGQVSFSQTLDVAVPSGQFVSATATPTTSLNTSEFSQTVAAQAAQFQPTLDLDADNSSTATAANFANVWTQAGGPVAIADSDAIISDSNSIHLNSLTAVLTNLVDSGFETLAADTTGTNITAAYAGLTGTLTLSGTASVAHYQQVLRTLTYDNTAILPTLGSRTIQMQLSDGTQASNLAITTLTLEAFLGSTSPTLDLDGNDSSGATGSSFNTPFTEDGPAIAIADSDAELTDSDSPNLQSLTVRITNLLDGLDELLSADTSGTSLSASYDSSTGTLTLSGLDTVANYEQVLRLVRYNNSSQRPTSTERLIDITATDGLNSSNTATATVTVQAVNDAPTITSHGGGASASVSIDENTTSVTTITADDVDDAAAKRVFAMSGGADAGQFLIDSNTGALRFAIAPDFELPSDVDGDNVYEVEVHVSDGALTDTQTVLVTINDVASTIVVTTTADIDDTGLGDAYTSEQLNAHSGTDQRVSLREAIIAANNTPGSDGIAFALSTDDPNFDGTVFTIVLNDVLPTITAASNIKGATQTVSGGDTNAGQVGTGGTVGVDGIPLSLFDKPEIQINANGFVGLTIAGDASQVTVSGLAIYNATHGIDILGGTGHDITITEMVIGLHADGSVPVLSERSTSHGIVIESGADASLVHNYIGHVGKSGILAVEPASTVTVEFNEVFATGWNSLDHDGLDIDGVHSVVRFNLVSAVTTASGLETSGGGSGIELGSTTDPTGNNLIENNTLVGNVSAGLRLRAGADNNVIRKNVVRSNADGIAVQTNGNTFSGNVVTANTDDGFDISGSNNTIGGMSPGTGNVVVFNADNGIAIPSGTGNAILGNVIADNGNLGIELDTSGLDSNDVGDADRGANNRQNVAVITAVTSNDDDTVRIVGTLDSTPDHAFRIEFFLNPVGQSDPSGAGEGVSLLTAETLTTDARGLATFDITLNFFLADGHEISAITTDLTTHDSSEFSRNGRVTAHAPTVDRATFDLDENSSNGTRVGVVTASDVDPDEQLTFSLSSGNTNDAFAIDATTGEITVANSTVLDREARESFTLGVTVRDRSGRTGTNEVTISLNDLNDITPIIPSEQQFTIAENSNIGVVIGHVIAIDSDTLGQLQDWSILSGNIGGAFGIDAATGVLTVNSSLPLDFETTPTFSLTIDVSDGVQRSASQTVLVNLTNVNEAPTLVVPGQQTIEEDGVAVFAPLFGTSITLADADVPASDLELTLRVTAGRLSLAQTTGLTMTGGADGTRSITVRGSLTALNDALDGLTYHASNDFFGSDLIVLEVSDLGQGGSDETRTNSASIAVDVLPINDVPTATDDSYALAEDGTLVVGTSDRVLGNDSDPDNAFLNRASAAGLTAFVVTGPTQGSLSFHADGTFSYTPHQNFHGTDRFTYQATDGSATSNIATVTLGIAAVNDAPIGVADAYTGNQLETLKITAGGVLANDSDVEGDTLTAILVTGPRHGTVTLRADGSFDYTPNGTYFGTDSFIYRTHDGTEASGHTTVRITVRQTIGIGPGSGGGSTDGGTTDGGSTNGGDSTPTDGSGSSGGGSTTGGGTNSGGDTTHGSPTPGGPTGITPFAPGANSDSNNRSGPTPDDSRTSESDIPGDGPGSIARIVLAETRFSSPSGPRNLSLRDGGLSVMPFSTIWAFDSADSVVQTFEQGTLWQQLNTLQQHVSDSSNDVVLDQLVVGSTAAVGTSLTVGYVIWILRGGSILVGMVSSLPAWTMIDPLPILETANAVGLANIEDDDSLQTILDRARDDIQKATPSQ